MSHIDTLETYTRYLESGFSEEQSLAMTKILENSFITKVKELRDDFASNKLVSILGGVILAALLGIGGELWVLSNKVSSIDNRLEYFDKRITNLENR